MAIPSPLEPMYVDAGVTLVPFGTPRQDDYARPEQTLPAPKLALVVESLELEYTALRKSCVLMDEPQRALVEVTGADRVEFLHRMLTQDVKAMRPFDVRRSFWLNRKGRIDADVVIIGLPDRILLDLPSFCAAGALESLKSYVIGEDVTIRDVSNSWHRFTLHGPTTPVLLTNFVEAVDGVTAGTLEPMQACLGRPQGSTRGDGRRAEPSVLFREDLAGVYGFSMWVPVEAAEDIFQRAIEMGHSHAHPGRAPLPILGQGGNIGARAEQGKQVNDSIRLRLAGWHAFNIARLEAGVPLFLLDFGPDSLPHESGVLKDRVSFKKGCYLGQEVVARMESRGHSKSVLVRLRAVDSYEGELQDRPLPEAGARVWDEETPETGVVPRIDESPIGRVTSSVLSPMRGSQPIALASVKPMAKGSDTLQGRRVRVECIGVPGGAILMDIE